MNPVYATTPSNCRILVHHAQRQSRSGRFLQRPRNFLNVAYTVRRSFASKPDDDSRLVDLGTRLLDNFSHIREKYNTPKHPVVLAHGLLGFSELHLGNGWIPPVQYWRGIAQGLKTNGVDVITPSVPPSGSIEQRAEKLMADISESAGGKSVNIIGHSMGGIDARYMISKLNPTDFNVRSLTTIMTPHRGSVVADLVVDGGWAEPVLKLVRGVGFETAAFPQLTTTYMKEQFNPQVPDSAEVKYFSYGAMTEDPGLMSPLYYSYRTLQSQEGPNDGLVSVQSSRWGNYKGTLIGVNHLDLINWTNHLKWTIRSLAGKSFNFNAIAFYLDIADMLAKEDM